MIRGNRLRFSGHAATGALLCALLLCSPALSACGDSTPKTGGSAPPSLPGRWVADVARTRKAAEELAGGALEERWLAELDPKSCWLELGEDGQFVLQLGETRMPVTIKGTWAETKSGLEITPTSVNAQRVPPGERKTDTVRRGGSHLIVSQGTYGLYLRQAPK